jgi:hypothetical protein
MEGKPNIGTPIPSRYKASIDNHEQRIRHLEKLNNVVPNIPKTFENADTSVIEHNGYLIRRDLSSGFYTVRDVDGKQVMESTFKQLAAAKTAIDSRVSAQKLVEHRQHVIDQTYN